MSPQHGCLGVWLRLPGVMGQSSEKSPSCWHKISRRAGFRSVCLQHLVHRLMWSERFKRICWISTCLGATWTFFFFFQSMVLYQDISPVLQTEWRGRRCTTPSVSVFLFYQTVTSGSLCLLDFQSIPLDVFLHFTHVIKKNEMKRGEKAVSTPWWLVENTES